MTPPRADTDVRLRLGAVRLPALPEILLNLLELYRREDVQISEFANLISQDAAMAAKLMSVANSAAYRNRGPVHGVERALAVLGTETVKTLVISQSIFQAFYGLPALRNVDLRGFWQHAFLAAAVAREVARLLDYAREDEAYLAGLLHDIGRLGLLAAAPEAYAEGFFADDDQALCNAERRLLRVSHAEAGAWLVERWQLDAYLADSVRYHHEPLPQVVSLHPLLRIVAFAHLLAAQLPDAKSGLSPDVAEAGRICGLAPAQMLAVAATAQQKLKTAAEQLGLTLPPAEARSPPSAAADRLRIELSPMMVAATVLNDLPVTGGEPELLQRLADAARIVFQFSDVMVMLPDAAGRTLRWVGPAEASPSASLPPRWLEFSLPIVADAPLGEGLMARRPVFISRDNPAEPLSVAEDQLLRLLDTEQLVCLPLGGDGHAMRPAGALMCVGDLALVGGLRLKRDLLTAFMAQAQALRARALSLQASGERERAELAARHALGVRDLAHEVNNPLSIIQNYLSLLDVKLAAGPRRDGRESEETQSMVGDIAVLQEEVSRVGRLVQALGAPAPATPSGAVDANALIDEVVRLFRRTHDGVDGIEILAHGHPGANEVLADQDTLKQVLINLVKNAVEALSAEQLGPVQRVGRVVVANNGLVNRDGQLLLEISVRDNGPGMAPELLQRLFTQSDADGGDRKRRAVDHGRGLGLGIVHRLVAGLGGLVQCRSGPLGTSVDVFLPRRAGVQRSQDAVGRSAVIGAPGGLQ